MRNVVLEHHIGIMYDTVSAMNAIRLYSSSHPRAIANITSLHKTLTKSLAEQAEISYAIIGDTLLIQGKPFVDFTPATLSFIRMLLNKGIERITFMPGLSMPELTEFLASLYATSGLVIHSTKHIRLSRILRPDTDDPTLSGDPFMVGIEPEMTLRNVTLLQNIYGAIPNQNVMDVNGLEDFVHDFISTFNKTVNPLVFLASIRTEDEYTYVHTINVAVLTMSLASHLGFTGKQLVDITLTALVHDAGKMLIPNEILIKPSSLDDKEKAIMETHPILGAEYLTKQKGMPPMAVLSALEHHIRYDGTGYPFIKEGWRPSLVSQMISVADVYDALRSRRSYRPPMEHEQVRNILLKDSGTFFNPQLVKHFLRMVEL